MKSIARLAQISIAIMAALTGCMMETKHADFPPVLSGEVDIIRGPGPGGVRQLDGQEIAALSHWLNAHRAGWHYVLETPPHPKATLMLNLAEGRLATLEVFENCPVCTGWDTTLVISGYDRTGDTVQRFLPADFKPVRDLIHN